MSFKGVGLVAEYQMGELLAWFEIVLILGGAFVALGGMLWGKISDAISSSLGTKESDIGLFVMLGGCAMCASGLLLVWLIN
jgi:hypothetical protein